MSAIPAFAGSKVIMPPPFCRAVHRLLREALYESWYRQVLTRVYARAIRIGLAKLEHTDTLPDPRVLALTIEELERIPGQSRADLLIKIVAYATEPGE